MIKITILLISAFTLVIFSCKDECSKDNINNLISEVYSTKIGQNENYLAINPGFGGLHLGASLKCLEIDSTWKKTDLKGNCNSHFIHFNKEFLLNGENPIPLFSAKVQSVLLTFKNDELIKINLILRNV